MATQDSTIEKLRSWTKMVDAALEKSKAVFEELSVLGIHVVVTGASMPVTMPKSLPNDGLERRDQTPEAKQTVSNVSAKSVPTAKPHIIDGANTARKIFRKATGPISGEELAGLMYDNGAWSGERNDPRLRKAVRNILRPLYRNEELIRTETKGANKHALWQRSETMK